MSRFVSTHRASPPSPSRRCYAFRRNTRSKHNQSWSVMDNQHEAVAILPFEALGVLPCLPARLEEHIQNLLVSVLPFLAPLCGPCSDLFPRTHAVHHARRMAGDLHRDIFKVCVGRTDIGSPPASPSSHPSSRWSMEYPSPPRSGTLCLGARALRSFHLPANTKKLICRVDRVC